MRLGIFKLHFYTAEWKLSCSLSLVILTNPYENYVHPDHASNGRSAKRIIIRASTRMRKFQNLESS